MGFKTGSETLRIAVGMGCTLALGCASTSQRDAMRLLPSRISADATIQYSTREADQARLYELRVARAAEWLWMTYRGDEVQAFARERSRAEFEQCLSGGAPTTPLLAAVTFQRWPTSSSQMRARGLDVVQPGGMPLFTIVAEGVIWRAVEMAAIPACDDDICKVSLTLSAVDDPRGARKGRVTTR